jgi:hypothetical protein
MGLARALIGDAWYQTRITTAPVYAKCNIFISGWVMPPCSP